MIGNLAQDPTDLFVACIEEKRFDVQIAEKDYSSAKLLREPMNMVAFFISLDIRQKRND